MKLIPLPNGVTEKEIGKTVLRREPYYADISGIVVRLMQDVLQYSGRPVITLKSEMRYFADAKNGVSWFLVAPNGLARLTEVERTL